jgi:hypothetical protein
MGKRLIIPCFGCPRLLHGRLLADARRFESGFGRDGRRGGGFGDGLGRDFRDPFRFFFPDGEDLLATCAPDLDPLRFQFLVRELETGPAFGTLNDHSSAP